MPRVRSVGLLSCAAVLALSGCSRFDATHPTTSSSTPSARSTLAERQVIRTAVRYLTGTVDALPAGAYLAVELGENPPFSPATTHCWSGTHVPPDRPQRITLEYWVGGVSESEDDIYVDRLDTAVRAQHFARQADSPDSVATYRSADGFVITIDDNEASEDSLSVAISTPCIAESRLDHSDSSAPTEIRHPHSGG